MSHDRGSHVLVSDPRLPHRGKLDVPAYEGHFMNTPRSVRLKLERVEEHMAALDEAISGFLQAEPYAARRVVKGAGCEHVVQWERYTEPPDRLGLIAGDAIHNLRSSLDHMVVALAKAGAASAGVAIAPAEEARLQFPIATTAVSFRNQINACLRHVAPDAQKFIEGRQPYNIMPNDPKSAALWIVSDLDNADKHRSLTIAGLSTAIVTVNWPPELDQIALQPPSGGAPRVPGAEIAHFSFPTPQSEEAVPLEYRWGFSLGHASAIDIRVDLRRYISVVEGALGVLSDHL